MDKYDFEDKNMNDKQEAKNTKGNSFESLYSLFVMRVLIKYSDPSHPMTCDEVMEKLNKDYEIGSCGEDKTSGTYRSQKKKFARIMDTLVECYSSGAFGKYKGKNNCDPHRWYYCAECDVYAADSEGTMGREELSETEVEYLIDVIASSKILNRESTYDIIEKLLKKIDTDERSRRKKLEVYRNESWVKNLNEELFKKKERLDALLESDIEFDYYESEENIRKKVTATALALIVKNGNYVLLAKEGRREKRFFIENMTNIKGLGYSYTFDDEDTYAFEDVPEVYFEDDNCALDSFLKNKEIVKKAISDQKALRFKYLSYKGESGKIVLASKEKTVLPHSCVFTDEKYYMICADKDTQKINYYRLDLMSDVKMVSERVFSSDYSASVFDSIARAQEVREHPFMMAGRTVLVTFLVIESALDRVIDAFGSKVNISYEKQRKVIRRPPTKENPEENHSMREARIEKLFKVVVSTTHEEAFRWALANADAVELVAPQEIRDRLSRMASPIRDAYSTTVGDRAREVVDKALKWGVFEVSRYFEKEVALEAYKLLKARGALDAVRTVWINHYSPEEFWYLKDFVETRSVRIEHSPATSIEWISGFKKLSRVQFTDTKIEDVSLLGTLENIDFLMLVNSPVSDISMLGCNKKLKRIELRGTKVTDIGIIEKLKDLNEIDISKCHIKDYSPLLRSVPLKRLKVDDSVCAQITFEQLSAHHKDADITLVETSN